MIFKGTKVYYADNSGVKDMYCIRLFGGSNKKNVNVGEMIKIVVKTLRSKKKVVRKKMYLAVMIGIKKKIQRLDGSCIKYHQNRAVLLNEKNKFMGTRVYGPVSKEIKGGKTNISFRKIITCSHGTV